MINTKLSDFWSENEQNNITVINSDVYAGLCSLKDGSIQCAITSPPYWGQRDYGFNGQIGNESKYSEYIEKLEAVFRKLRDKLEHKGVFFLNIGDKYLSRYGNSKLGMIPYKLAKFMKDNGWILVDTIIWYKPNHMPGSYTNRFTSTYEPVFIFAKNRDNYYTEFVNKKKNYSNILKINLQPTQYNHIAVYPEKLVEELLKLGFPINSTVLDPFAGSGTTASATRNLNKNNLYHLKSILIEASEEYVDLIKRRLNISSKYIIKLPFKAYSTLRYIENEEKKPFKESLENKQKYSIRSIIKIFENRTDLENFVNEMKFGNIYNSLSNNGIIYLCILDNDIKNIFLISTLNLHSWVIRNQLIIKNGKNWYPIYLIVKDTKKCKYSLNIDAVRVKPKYNQDENFGNIDFTGYRVLDNLSKVKVQGVIVKILKEYKDGMPQYVIVKWETGVFTQEVIKHKDFIDETAFSFECPKCNTKLLNFYDEERDVTCPNCKTILWKSYDTIPLLKIIGEVYPKDSEKIETSITIKNTKKDYNGKFKDAKQINLGASPGARSSTHETYFSVQRYYDFPREMIADLFTIILKEKRITKKKIVEMFPKSYLHTIGHWFRKDMGGSLPAPEDAIDLKKILGINQQFIDLINSRCLVLQTVKSSYNGKNPGDFLEFKSIDEVYDFLQKTIN